VADDRRTEQQRIIEDGLPEQQFREDNAEKVRHAYTYSFTGAGIDSLAHMLWQQNFFDPTINSPGASALNNNAKQILIDLGIFPDPDSDQEEYRRQARRVVQALLDLIGDKE
jgi:hypothetical protein